MDGWIGGWVDVPIFAARFILRTLMHSATAAPELSMTFIMVCWRGGEYALKRVVVKAFCGHLWGCWWAYLELDHLGKTLRPSAASSSRRRMDRWCCAVENDCDMVHATMRLKIEVGTVLARVS